MIFLQLQTQSNKCTRISFIEKPQIVNPKKLIAISFLDWVHVTISS